MRAVEQLCERIEAALGRRPLDLLIQNVRLVNVYSGEIIATDIGVQAGRVASILPGWTPPVESYPWTAEGLYALPGFDRRPRSHRDHAAHAAKPGRGDRADRHHVTLRRTPWRWPTSPDMRAGSLSVAAPSQLPYRLFIQVPVARADGARPGDQPAPSCTWRRSGASWTGRCIEPGGTRSPPRCWTFRANTSKRCSPRPAWGKVANGHAIGLTGAELEAYAAAGLSDDHECVTFRTIGRAGQPWGCRDGARRKLRAQSGGVDDAVVAHRAGHPPPDVLHRR